jgi:hypothetical protein
VRRSGHAECLRSTSTAASSLPAAGVLQQKGRCEGSDHPGGAGAEQGCGGPAASERGREKGVVACAGPALAPWRGLPYPSNTKETGGTGKWRRFSRPRCREENDNDTGANGLTEGYAVWPLITNTRCATRQSESDVVFKSLLLSSIVVSNSTWYFFANNNNGAASARTSDPGASIGHPRDRRMGIESIFSRSIQSQGANVASVLRAIASNVASRLRATSKYQQASSPPPLMLRPCCDYVATMLRLVLRATSNIRSPPPRYNTNIICL